MESFKAVASGALGIAACLALLMVAGRLTVAWHRVVISVVAILGLSLQGVFWCRVACTFRQLEIGSCHVWMHAAIMASMVGIAWALVVLVTTFIGRGPD